MNGVCDVFRINYCIFDIRKQNEGLLKTNNYDP